MSILDETLVPNSEWNCSYLHLWTVFSVLVAVKNQKFSEKLTGKIYPGGLKCQSGKLDTFTDATALVSPAGFPHSNRQT